MVNIFGYKLKKRHISWEINPKCLIKSVKEFKIMNRPV